MQLIYHIYPRRGWALDLNLVYLAQYFDLFDEILVGVAEDSTTYTAAQIKHCFPQRTFFYNYKNTRDGEANTFKHFLPTLKANDYSFYAHCKGVTHNSSIGLITWIKHLYEKNLSQVPDLKSFGTIGILRKHEKKRGVFCKYKWCFSGTFFWLNNNKLMAKPDWQYIQPRCRYAVEYYPGNQFELKESQCLFWDRPNCDLGNINRWK